MSRGALGMIPCMAVAVLAVLPALSVGAGAEEVVLVEDGRPRAAVCVASRVMAPDKAGVSVEAPRGAEGETEFQRQQLRESVLDLVRCFEKMSGARLEIHADTTPPAGTVPIYVGELGVERFGAPKKTASFKQGFRVVVSKEGLGLIGESDLATSYAIYEVLDRLGCRWFMPSEWGECLPEMKTISLAQMDFNSVPGTLYRGIWEADQDYKRRNRLGGLPLAASHALDSYLTNEQLAQHPDWVAVIKGKPAPPAYKWTRPEIAEAVADTILAYLDKGVYKWSVSLSPEDTILFDESEDPKFDAGDFDPMLGQNSVTDRLLILCNRVAERVTAKYPEVLFGINAYVQYTRAPVRERVHPSIVPVIAPITYSRAHPVTEEREPNNAALRQAIEGWGKKARMIGIYYFGWFLVEQTAPNPMITKWGVDVPYALRNGCQFFQPETTSNFETSLHALWMGPRLAWDPSLKPEDVVEDIHTRFYGNAAKEMGEYWRFVDSIWIDTKEYSGTGGYMRRFTPERMQRMRALMNAAKVEARTPQEKFRVTMADESLVLFEKYMQMRRDLAEGNWAKLDSDALYWIGRRHAMAERYRAQYSFSARQYGAGGVWGDNNGVDNFVLMYLDTYKDAARIARFYDVLSLPPIRQWKFEVDPDKEGDAGGRQKPDFDDARWRTTDPVVDSWSALGYHNYFGRMWYRTTVQLPPAAPGNKTYLWIGATDGSCKVFVNGRHVPYVAPNGDKADDFVGYMRPASWNITDALTADGNTQVTLLCERRDLNEIGTGGLMGPVAVYRER